MSRTPTRRTPEDCPYRAEHTPKPDGYLEWHSWAHRMNQSHRQVRCKGCGLYAIWVSRGTNKRMMDPVVPDRVCAMTFSQITPVATTLPPKIAATETLTDD